MGEAGDGEIQGNPMAGLTFNIGLQKDLVILNINNQLDEYGGCAVSGQDDVFAIGPSPHIFAAIDAFQESFQSLWFGASKRKDGSFCLGRYPP